MTAHPPRPVGIGIRRRVAALLRALAALAVLTACLLGAPLLMWRLIGWPLPHHVPTRAALTAALTAPLDQRLVVGVLGCLFWYLYLQLAVSTLTETITRATGRRRPRLPTASLAQTLTTALVGTILTGLILTTTRAKLPASGPAATLTAYRTSTAITAPAHPTPDDPAPTAPAPAATSLPTCVVPAYASLWSLADTHLGDPLRYSELFELNQGLLQPDGGRLTDPDLIRPGWILLLPADAAPSESPSVDPPGPAAAEPVVPPEQPDIPPAPLPPAPATQAPTLPPPTSPAPASASPARTPPEPASASPARTSPAPASPVPRPVGHPDPIRLPSGPVLPAGLLAAIAIAVTVTRLLRHRGRPSHQRTRPPADPPLPLIIWEILRSGHTLPDLDDGAAPVDDDPPTGAENPHPDRHHDTHPSLDHPTPPPPAGPPRPSHPDLTGALAPQALPVPARLGPASASHTVTAAVPAPRPPRPGLHGPATPIRLPTALRTTGGISVPDPDAARALIVTVLAAHHTPAGADPHHLIISRDAAAVLHLPEQLLTRLPQVTLTPTGTDALTAADQQLLTRRRLATDHEVVTLEQLRVAAPDEDLPPVLLVLTPDPTLFPRLDALASPGAALDIVTVALGAWPGHPCWPDPADTSEPAWALPAGPAADLLDLLDQATPRDPQPPTDPAPHTPIVPTGGWIPTIAANGHPQQAASSPPSDHPPAPTVDPAITDPVTSTAPAPDDASPAAPATADDTGPATTGTHGPGRAAAQPEPAPAATGRDQVRLMLLGRPHLRQAENVIYQGRLGLEIAGYLALHRDRPTTTATLLAALLPDVDPDRAKDQIYQAIRRLREALRQTGTDQVVLSDRNGYRLADTISCDLWDVEVALTAAERTTDDDSRTAALRTATRLYTGRLLDGCEWASAHATHLEHRMIDAAADLADLLADTTPAIAADILEQAISHAPYTEALYTHLMRLHAATGHTADVHRVYRRLVGRLADLATTPSPHTDALLARLTRPTR
ncbi:hypothetical protein MXD61_04555 [Frankia sp. AgPm24]|uniref:BTAD domain-containing putative transcriptional regulator n=1 Tax=Frankia sp. AgPm24 TaxID=631128 RepID=UPI002010909F|nr:BTAD domain-containing putative transcriptional regulator [Frankia sp. AgPm24]MCK9921181.1 hypothetical protein [Frankia sp. AgPm24]